MKNGIKTMYKKVIGMMFMISLFVIPMLSLDVMSAQAQTVPTNFSLSKMNQDAVTAKVAGGDTTSDANQFNDMLIVVIKYVLGFLGVLTVLIIVIAGIMYLTAGGDEDRVENAKRWLLYAIIGLTVALLGWVIVVSVEMLLKN